MSSVWTTSTQAAKIIYAISMANPYFEFIRHDVTEPLYVEVDQIYNLACPASWGITYQANPVKTTRDQRLRRPLNTLGLCQAGRRQNPAGKYQ